MRNFLKRTKNTLAGSLIDDFNETSLSQKYKNRKKKTS